MEMGDCSKPATDFALEEGERVLGIKSRIEGLEKERYHIDL
jgi:hypothetical protein